MPKKIYLAGPDVFLENAVKIGETKKNLCKEYGFEGLFPLDNVASGAKNIFEANTDLMNKADIGVFNLSPFRSPSADPGTVFELGYMFGQKKPVFGYSNLTPAYRERVSSLFPIIQAGNLVKDQQGYLVEDFNLTDNLMISCALEGDSLLFKAEPETNQSNLAALPAFEKCLAYIQKHFSR